MPSKTLSTIFLVDSSKTSTCVEVSSKTLSNANLRSLCFFPSRGPRFLGREGGGGGEEKRERERGRGEKREGERGRGEKREGEGGIEGGKKGEGKGSRKKEGKMERTRREGERKRRGVISEGGRLIE